MNRKRFNELFIYQALANSVRLEIVKELRKGAKTKKNLVNSLAKHNLNYSKLTHHLSKLKKAGIVGETSFIRNGKEENFVYLKKDIKLTLQPLEEPLINLPLLKTINEMLLVVKKIREQLEKGTLPKEVGRVNLNKIKKMYIRLREGLC